MSEQLPGSHRQILRATSIIGGSSVANIGIGLLRLKAAALLLGPAGIGLIGLLQNLMAAGSTVAGLGFGTAGTRQIAEAGAEGKVAVRSARQALLLGSAVLAFVGAVVFWLLRHQLAWTVVDHGTMAAEVGLVSLGVGLSVIAASQTALLTGLRRLGDVAMVTTVSAVLGSALALSMLLLFGARGIGWFVIAMPAASAVVGAVYVLRVPRPEAPPPAFHELTRQWRAMVRLGGSFAIASLLTLGSQLAVRVLVQRQLGVEALGLFQASWAIAMTYVAFVLQAMATDYYPRLTATISDSAVARRLVHDQTEVALCLGGPVLLAIMATAPWLIQLLYSSAFTGASELLRWQVLGDVAKLASWPVGFIPLAGGKGRAYLLTEVTGAATLVGCTWIALPLFGLEGAGMAYATCYVVYLLVVMLVARRTIAFAWTMRTCWLLVSLGAAAIVAMAVSSMWPLAGAAVGLLLAAAFFTAAFVTIRESTLGPLAQLFAAHRRGRQSNTSND